MLFYEISMKIIDFHLNVTFLFQKEEYHTSASWDDQSDLCMLKVGGKNGLFFLFKILRIAFVLGSLLNSKMFVNWLHSKSFFSLPPFLSLVQIYGIKTLVKSYLPVKDAHVRPDIDSLLGILRNMLSYGEISKDLQSRYLSFRLYIF